MTTPFVVATHTGSLTPSSDPWTFVGTVTWQSDIDPAILPRLQVVATARGGHVDGRVTVWIADAV